jgi:hypothetical protein
MPAVLEMSRDKGSIRQRKIRRSLLAGYFCQEAKSAPGSERPVWKQPFDECAAGIRIYQAGEIIEKSGIYQAVHLSEHNDSHSATLIRGHRFPDCETCLHSVSYHLVRTAPYLFHDEDFNSVE